jgi:hypothetical protein
VPVLTRQVSLIRSGLGGRFGFAFHSQHSVSCDISHIGNLAKPAT